jgi:uncharacterized protein involved in exopolysaccharide biosynthesis
MDVSDNVISFKVDDELHRYLKQKDNASAYLRRLVKADMKGEDAELVGLRSQIETLEQQAQTHAEQEEMYQNRAEELREVLQQSQERTDLGIAKAREQLSDTPRDPKNPGIQRWAEKLGMTPTALCEKLDGNNTVQ